MEIKRKIIPENPNIPAIIHRGSKYKKSLKNWFTTSPDKDTKSNRHYRRLLDAEIIYDCKRWAFYHSKT